MLPAMTSWLISVSLERTDVSKITEYGDEAECQKAADKLIMRKTKKGYKPAPRKQNRSLSNQQSHHRHRLRQHHNVR